MKGRADRTDRDRRTGGAVGNVLLVLAALLVFVALLSPRWRARASAQHVGAAVHAVNAIRTEAEEVLDATGAWPPSSDGTDLAPDVVPEDSGVTFEWRRIASAVVPRPADVEATFPEMSDELGPEPPVAVPEYFARGAISVHTGNEAVLGGLLERYPGSFVHDTVWTLLLPRVSAPPE